MTGCVWKGFLCRIGRDSTGTPGAGSEMELRCLRATDDKLRTLVERPGALHNEIYKASGRLGLREAGPKFWTERMGMDDDEEDGELAPWVLDGLRQKDTGGDNEIKEDVGGDR